MPRWIYIPTSQHSAGIINILIILPNLLQGLFIVGAACTPPARSSQIARNSQACANHAPKS